MGQVLEFSMDSRIAIQELKELIRTREALAKATARKRSWRPSEKAAAIASYKMQVRALNKAIQALS